MGYIGQVPVDEFVAVPTKDSFTGDGSTTTFDLAASVASGSVNALDVFIDNVRQEPGSGKAFTLGVDGSGDMKRITFTSAPASSAVIYVLNPLTNTQAIAPLPTDLNGVELILDADGDTSITADTDDRIDFRASGADQIQLADGVLKPVTDSDVDLGTSSLYFKNAYIDTVTTTGNVTVGGDLTITGTTSFADTNITNVGSIALDTITNDGTDVTIDSSGDIILDADGTQIFLKDAGTTFGSLTQTGGELVIKSSSSDTTALTFAGANATLAGTLGVGAITGTSTIQGTTITATTAFVPDASDGAALGTTSLEFSDLYLADAAVIGFGDDQDVTLTHVVDTGLLLSSTDQLQFGDSGTYIFQSADGVLDLVSDTEIELNATTLDINANVEISGTATTTGVHTFTAVPVFPNDTVETADIQDNAVSLAKMAGLARGKIIYGNASGDPTALTVGSSGQALVSDGTDISWGSGGAIATYSNSTNNRVITSVDSSSVNSEANLTFDGSTLAVTGAATISTTLAVTGIATFTGVPVLPANTIDSAHYVDGSIDNAHIADDAIDSEHYADGSIDNAHIADDAIDSEHYAAGSIDTAHIAADQIVASLIADNAIDSEHYTDGSIDNAHIADDAIDSEHYADGSIDNAHIADDQINSEHYAAASIDNEHLADDAVGVAELSATGTASSSTFLRGDNAWVALSSSPLRAITYSSQSNSISNGGGGGPLSNGGFNAVTGSYTTDGTATSGKLKVTVNLDRTAKPNQATTTGSKTTVTVSGMTDETFVNWDQSDWHLLHGGSTDAGQTQTFFFTINQASATVSIATGCTVPSGSPNQTSSVRGLFLFEEYSV